VTDPNGAAATGRGIYELDAEMAELLVLLPAAEAGALERAAKQRGLTAGQLLRRLIRDFLDPVTPPRCA
jgi:hypothetical protein